MNTAAKIKHPVTFYTDGSGAPCVIECDGQTYAFDFLGKEKCVRIDGNTYLNNKRSLYMAKWCYRDVMENAPAGWMEKNKEMYK